MRTTRRAIATAAAAGVLVTLGFTTAIAANYHTGKTLICSDCHVTHASLAHNDGGLALDEPLTPALHLTKAPSPSETCLQCHNNREGIPDVLGADANNPSEVYDGTERSGGHFSELPSDSWKGHTLPGQGHKAVECGECHDPHGNANYRNLRALDGAPTGPIAFINPAITGLDRYRRSNVGYVKNIGDKLCIRCHENARLTEMEAPGLPGRYLRHPSSGEGLLVTAMGDRSDARHWVEGTGRGFVANGQVVPRVPFAVSRATSFLQATTVSTDNEVFCLSCHKAHGSNEAFGLLWPYGSRDAEISSSGCNQCHNITDQ